MVWNDFSCANPQDERLGFLLDVQFFYQVSFRGLLGAFSSHSTVSLSGPGEETAASISALGSYL